MNQMKLMNDRWIDIQLGYLGMMIVFNCIYRFNVSKESRPEFKVPA